MSWKDTSLTQSLKSIKLSLEQSYVSYYHDSVELVQNYDNTHEVIENIGTVSVLTWPKR